MGRSPCCSKVGLIRGPWSSNEDTLLTNYILHHGEGQWRSLPKNAGLLRCGKSCRLRWMNYLRPGIKRGNINKDEEDLIVRLHALLGNRWSLIAGRLPGRTDNEIKNYWNTHLKKIKNNVGIHPIPRRDLPKSNPGFKNMEQKRATAVDELDKNGEPPESIDPPKTTVYLPKAVRVSSASSDFLSSCSYESLTSGTSSSDGWYGKTPEEVVAPVEWPPLFEVADGRFGEYIHEECFMGGEYGRQPLLSRSEYSISGDEEMLDKVYDEYLQLL